VRLPRAAAADATAAGPASVELPGAPLELRHAPDAEWLEADGLGGFASGTVSGVRTRRYHALLLAAATPPTGRVALVQGIEAWIERGGERVALTAHRYDPGLTHPDGDRRLVGFDPEPWPRWTFRLDDGLEVVQELFVPRDQPTVALAFRLARREPGVTLVVRPLISGRDLHALHHENPGFRFDAVAPADGAAAASPGHVVWSPYPGVPAIRALSNGTYRHAPDWWRGFFYAEERARGLDDREDLASPGEFRFDLSKGEAALLCTALVPGAEAGSTPPDALGLLKRLRTREARRRAALGGPLLRAADQYVVRRANGRTIVAGYPWFTDWGRDTFIAMRGLCLATGRLDEAGRMLAEWAGAVSQGMLPNLFPDGDGEPMYNAVDASLWYVVAAREWLDAWEASGAGVPRMTRSRLRAAVEAIVTGYARGTRYGIRMDADGLLACGEPGVQLTWMDAKIGDWVVTPRTGKPVEVQALWINALAAAAEFAPRFAEPLGRARRSFLERFWNEEAGWLNDVVDVDHEPGRIDATFRPNQALALGGLPVRLVAGSRAERVIEQIERRLWTPLGLRSLEPAAPGYRGRYEGGVWERDSAYHQGPVWPWLSGAFVDAWVRSRGGTPEAKRDAWERFVRPLHAHLAEAGLGHVSEIADGDHPHAPRGCPFQAWSVGELIRLERVVLAGRAPRGAAALPGAAAAAVPPAAAARGSVRTPAR
jgi:predicted glycogen debranching enzyme